MSPNLPILVIGAGPVGLVSAIILARNGVPVRIIEKRDEFHGAIRGTALMPRTLEALETLGISVTDISTPPLQMAFYGPDGRTAKVKPWATVEGDSQYLSFVEPRSVSQSQFEALLREHLAKYDVQVERGAELVDFVQDEAKVTSRIVRTSGEEETAEFAYVVAADGAKGHTRRQLGIPFVGESRVEDRILSGNVYVSGVDNQHWHMWGNMGTEAVGLKPMRTESLFQLQALGHNLPAELPTDLEGIRQLFARITGRDDIIIHDAQWVSEWRANIRMCQKFGDKRVFLAGDSAHCHSPFGGQGMNSGIQDAVNICWKLALFYHGHASQSLLETYTDERVPVIAEMLNLSSNIHYLVFGKPAASTLVSTGEQTDVDNEKVMERPTALHQLGMNYRWSPIVLDTRANANVDTAMDPYGQRTHRLRAGDRAPDARVSLVTQDGGIEATTLHDLADLCRHVVLVFTRSPGVLSQCKEELGTIAEWFEKDLAKLAVVLPQGADVSATSHLPDAKRHLLVDKTGEAWRVYDLEGETTYVIVRPDGVIGAVTEDAAGLGRYFDKLTVGGRQ